MTLLVSDNSFHVGCDSPLTVFCSLTLILSFLSAFCLFLRPGALWELSRCIWWKGLLLSQPLACIGILISIHYYQWISTPSPFLFMAFSQPEEKYTYSMCIDVVQDACHDSTSIGSGNVSLTSQSLYSSASFE